MVRLVGLNRKKGRKRLVPSPSAWSPVDGDGTATAGGAAFGHRSQQPVFHGGSRQRHCGVPPMYQYALNEYAQTVAAGTSNDAGKLSDDVDSSSWSGYDEPPTLTRGVLPDSHLGALPQNPTTSSSDDSLQAQAPASPRSLMRSQTGSSGAGLRNTASLGGAAASDFSSSKPLPPLFLHPLRSPFEAETVPDAAYEEIYGDAYTGGPIKYVYPSGYQSMRPRSCPWKLSIVVCVLFTWLSVFIVGHCSDQVKASAKYKNEEIDDDTVALQIRWCGSRPLYLMWVTSMLITGLAAAYCSVIGYIKVRDFAVANMRSQPPGVVATGKSDYYLRIDDSGTGGGPRPPHPPHRGTGDDASSSVSGASSDPRSFRPSIYQSDGTPQFWGAHIYRPTQAAVAVTSR